MAERLCWWWIGCYVCYCYYDFVLWFPMIVISTYVECNNFELYVNCIAIVSMTYWFWISVATYYDLNDVVVLPTHILTFEPYKYRQKVVNGILPSTSTSLFSNGEHAIKKCSNSYSFWRISVTTVSTLQPLEPNSKDSQEWLSLM